MKVEIKVMWCKGIAAFNFFQKLTPYVVVSIHTIDERFLLSESQKQEQKTHVDNDGDANPEWHYIMHFDLDDTMMLNLGKCLLFFEIRNHGQILMDRNIGDVKVPLNDLVHSVGYGVVRFASYEVRSFDGKSNGVLDFSYKVMGHHDYDHVGQSGSLDLDRVDYSRVQIDGYGGTGGNGVPSAPPLFGGEENGLYQAYSPVYPSSGPSMWASPPPPPPPRPQPVAYRPPPEEYYNNQQHSGGESCYGYHGYSPRPRIEEYYYRQHSGCEGCEYHDYSPRLPPQEYYNRQHSGSESCGYHGYSYRPPPPAPAPAPAAGNHYYHQHSNSGGGGGYHHW